MTARAQNQTHDIYILPQADVPTEVKRKLLEEDAQRWRNSRFLAESRRRTAKRIGDTENEAAQMKILEQCEGALMDLEEQAKELI